MQIRQKLTILFALSCFPAAAGADPLVYVITGSQQFGRMDIATATFSPISPIPATIQYLVSGSNGSLLTMSFDGNLDSINPATGAISVIGPTGFADCTTPTTPTCGPNSQLSFGKANGTLYATTFDNRLYTINPLTGKATLIGNTGIPAAPFIVGATNPDGSLNIYDENLFEAEGKLYANFDAGTLDLSTFTVTTAISPALYQIDLNTGAATKVAPTDEGLVSITNVNGTVYAFDAATNQLLTLDVTNGKTTFIRDIDPSLGLIAGVAAVSPEPASFALTGLGITLFLLNPRRKIRRADFLAD
jgi:WD40 repeat protein